MAQSQMIRLEDTTEERHLYIAFELSQKKWKLAFGDGIAKRYREIEGRALKVLEWEIERAKEHFKLLAGVKIYSCYEAGRDGFWLHRYLESRGIENIIVDSSSIEVNRRYRRAKTDRLDASKLLQQLLRYRGGERKVWSVVRVPTVGQEDNRRRSRERERILKEQTSHKNRLRSLLMAQGIDIQINKNFKKHLEKIRLWDGGLLPENLKKEMLREYERYEIAEQQTKEMGQERAEYLKTAREVEETAKQVEKLQKLRGIGPESSWALAHEFFWREFSNGRQVGAAAGLAPTPYGSGNYQIEQGISKAGNRRVRKVLIEVGWYWLRYQGNSKLSQWFMKRFADGGKRMRRTGIVALARKLLIAIWRYLDAGIVPEGAELKA